MKHTFAGMVINILTITIFVIAGGYFGASSVHYYNDVDECGGDMSDKYHAFYEYVFDEAGGAGSCNNPVKLMNNSLKIISKKTKAWHITGSFMVVVMSKVSFDAMQCIYVMSKPSWLLRNFASEIFIFRLSRIRI